MNSIVDWLKGLSGPVVYLVVGALVFAEDALFVGFVLPGETAAVVGGFIAHQGKVSLPVMMAVVVAAAILGDSTGYEIGRHFGPRILTAKSLQRHQARVGKAQEFLRRHGPSAVFLGRFVAFFRAMMPALSGLSRLPYPKFLTFNALGGVVWGVGFVLLGYLAGNAYQRVEKTVGRDVAVFVALLVIAALVTWRVRRSRAEKAEEEKAAEAATAERKTTEPETAGPETAEPERAEPETTGPETTGPKKPGPDQSEPDSPTSEKPAEPED